MVHDRPEKLDFFLFLLRPISLTFIWNMSTNKIQIEVKKEGYAPIGPGVMGPGVPVK